MSHRAIRVYKASAGSGKTFSLAAEFIANLINDYEHGEQPHRHQLAITFTKKATAEMKERILQSLFDLWQNSSPNDSFFKAVREQVTEKVTDKVLKERAGQALREIVHGYEQFHVTTIDSFFQHLLTSLAHELGLTSSFKVDLGDGAILSKAVDQLMHNLSPGSEVLEWITHYIAEQLDEGRSWNVTRQLKDLAEELLKEPYLKFGDLLRELPLDNHTVGKYRNTLRKLRKSQEAHLAQVAEEAKSFIEQTEGFERISAGNKNIRPRLDKHIHLQKVGERKPTLNKHLADGATLLKASDRSKADLLEWAENVRQHLLKVEQTYDKVVPIINSCSLSLQHLNALRLLDDIDKHVRLLNHENNAFMLAHTPLLFAQLVSGAEASFVFERAGTQYRHVMIDEFQDTSTLQWSNLQHLLVENIAQGNSCMLVGDVKQGIYRWRGGDWTALSQMKNSETIEVKTLDANYRSGERIVRFNNVLFVHLAQQLASEQAEEKQENAPIDVEQIYQPEEVEQRTVHQGGYVRLSLRKSTKQKEGEESEELTEDIEKDLGEQILRLYHQGVPYEKMAILVRRNAEVKQVFEHFEEDENLRQIPLVSDEAFLLSASPAVQTIVHALRYIYRTDDDVARAYITRLAPKEEVETILTTLRTWHTQRFHSLPFYELVVQLVRMFQLDSLDGQSPYIYAFLDNVLAFLEDNAPDLRRFLEEWEERLHKKSIPSTVVKGVRILTIHKSKGLAYHSVFIPYCNWDIESDKAGDLLWVRPESSPYNAIPFLPIPCKSATAQSIYQTDYEEEHRNRRIENLNLLYVAFTRARQNLLVWGHTKKDGNSIATLLRETIVKENSACLEELQQKEGNALHVNLQDNGGLIECGAPSILECMVPDGGEMLEQNNPLIIDTEGEALSFRLHANRAQFRQSHKARAMLATLDEDSTTPHFDLEQYRARRIGVALHALMERIETLDDVERVVREARFEGELADSLPADEVIHLLHRALRHPEACKWFDGTWQLYRECSILKRADNGQLLQQRPDRVMMREGEVVVVDYKFGVHRSYYVEQVKAYCELLRQMGHRQVQGYIWYVAAGNLVQVDA